MPQNPQRRGVDRARSAAEIQASQSVARHCDRPGAGVGRKVLKLARKAGAHHVLRRQQRQKSQKGDTTPGQETKRRSEKADAHRHRVSNLGVFRKSGAGKPPWRFYALRQNGRGSDFKRSVHPDPRRASRTREPAVGGSPLPSVVPPAQSRGRAASDLSQRPSCFSFCQQTHPQTCLVVPPRQRLKCE